MALMRRSIEVCAVLVVVALGAGCGDESDGDAAEVRVGVPGAGNVKNESTADRAESNIVQPKASFIAAVEGLCEATITRRRAVPEVATPEGTEALNEEIDKINDEMLGQVRALPQPERPTDAALAAELYEGRERSTELWDAYENAAQTGNIARAEAIYEHIESAEASVEELLDALGLSDRCFVG